MAAPVLVFRASPRRHRRRRPSPAEDPIIERITTAARMMAARGRVAYLHVIETLLQDAIEEHDTGPHAG